MDYVLFGMGYGATLMLLGWALRTFGPNRKYTGVDESDIDRTVLQRRWIRFIQGLGGVVSIAGTALVVFTFIVMLVNPDDETGAFISLAIWGFIAIAVLIWCWFYVSNFGVTGVWSRQSGYRSESPTASDEESASSSSRVVPKPRISDRSDAVVEPADTEADEASVEPIQDDPSVEPTADVEAEEVIGPSMNDPEPAPGIADENDPEYDFGDSTDTTVPSEIGGRTEAIRRIRERRANSGSSTN